MACGLEFESCRAQDLLLMSQRLRRLARFCRYHQVAFGLIFEPVLGDFCELDIEPGFGHKAA